MTPNDKSLIQQMIKAGKFNDGIYDLLVAYNKQRAKELIIEMGEKYCCHPKNFVKRLDVPLPLLSEPRPSKVLTRKKS